MTADLGPLYGDGSRALQDHFDTRRLADRLEELTVHEELTADDQGYPEIGEQPAEIKRTGLKAFWTSLKILWTCLKEAPELAQGGRMAAPTKR